MKKISLIIPFLLCIQIVDAQIWDEWFRQNSTQKKYLLQQIAALRVYTSYLEKGYSIARNGLGTIQQLRQGEVNLHTAYFNSLSAVNPAIIKYSVVANILILQKNVLKEWRQAMLQFRTSHQFTITELSYLTGVGSKLIAASAVDMRTLSILIKNNNLKLTDDERLTAIEELYKAMEDKLSFIRSFANGNKELALQRGKEVIDIIISKKINALK